MMNSIKLVTLSLLSVVTINSYAQTAEEIVTKHIEAIGGIANWDNIKSQRVEGKVKAQGMEIAVTRTQVDKKAMRMDIAVMGMTGYQILTNTEGWAYMPFQGQTKSEPMTADDVKSSQDELSIKDDFITYKDQGKKIEFIGKEDYDGTECLKLKMIDKDAVETTYFLDPENYYVLKQTTKVKANGQEMEAVTTFSDYKKLPEGIVCPMVIGGDFGDMEVQKYEVNPAIDDAIFKPSN
jgi:hypothetical protein